jgi:hypothetical protein
MSNGLLMSRSERSQLNKKILPDSAIPEYKRKGDFLIDCVDWPTKRPVASTRETLFHKGFYRRPQNAIKQDDERITKEQQKLEFQDNLNKKRIETYIEYKKDHSELNILTDSGPSQSSTGIKIVKPINSISPMKIPGHHFYDPSGISETRKDLIKNEGLFNTIKESVVLGLPTRNATVRMKIYSNGVQDNFEHTQLKHGGPPLTIGINKNASQIQF